MNFKNGFAHILLLIGGLVIATAAYFLYNSGFFQNFGGPHYLAVVYANPTGSITNNSQKIVIQFNMPVSAHHIQEYYTITPPIPGQLKQGADSKTIIFEPSEPYPYSITVDFILKMGLPSDKGKRLPSDYVLTFYTAQNQKTVDFVNKGISAKFMSFSKDAGLDVSLQVGAEISKPTVKIFKADVKNLLESFIYIPEYAYGSYRNGAYKEVNIDTSKLTLVKEHKDMEDSSKINFKGEMGLYLIQAVKNGNVLNNAWFTLNQTAIHLRQDDQNIYLAAQDINGGQPQSGIDVTFYQLSESAKEIARHTLGNIQQYPLVYPNYLDIVIGIKGQEVILVPVSIPNSQAELKVNENLNEETEIFIYTDRPIYKKGDKVSYRGVVRIDNDGIYRLPNEGSKVNVYIGSTTDSKERVLNQTVYTNSDGTFSGEFKVEDNFYDGTNYLYAATNLDSTRYSSDYAYFDVSQYVKPDFGLEINSDIEEVVRGDTVKVNFGGQYFNGKALAEETVSYTVYKRDFYETEKAVYNSSFNLNSWGGMCGGGLDSGDEYFGEPIGGTKNINLDSSGKGFSEFNTKDLGSGISQEITFVIEKKDRNGNKIISAKNVVVHTGEFNIFFRPGPNSVKMDEEFINAFYAEDLDGKKLENKSFKYSFYEEAYSGDYKKPNRTIIKSGNVMTDNEGLGVIKERLKGEGQYSTYLEITGTDGRNNAIETRKYVYIIPKQQEQFNFNRETILKILSEVNNLTPGKNGKLTIESPVDLSVFVTFDRGRVYKPQWLNLKKGSNIFEFSVDDTFIPSITPTFSFIYNGQYYIEGLSLNVPAISKLVNIEISPDKNTYSKGDTAVITIITKDSNNNPIFASLGVGIVDKAIFALRKNAASPIHSSFYFFRPRATNASSSLTWIGRNLFGGGGGGGGGGGAELFIKDVDTLYWNPSLRTGSDGKLTINVPLGNTQTVWRILVYSSTDNTYLGQGQLDISVR